MIYIKIKQFVNIKIIDNYIKLDVINIILNIILKIKKNYKMSIHIKR